MWREEWSVGAFTYRARTMILQRAIIFDQSIYVESLQNSVLTVVTGVNLALEDLMVPSQSWCKIEVNNWYIIASNTLGRMERAMTKLTANGVCHRNGCKLNEFRKIWLQQHVENHNLINLCSCGYSALYRDTTAKHGSTRHHDDQLDMIQVDKDY